MASGFLGPLPIPLGISADATLPPTPTVGFRGLLTFWMGGGSPDGSVGTDEYTTRFHAHHAH